MKKINPLFLVCLALSLIGLTFFASCSLFKKEQKGPSTFSVFYSADGEPARFGYVTCGGAETISAGETLSFEVCLRNGYLPEQLRVLNAGNGLLDPISIKFSDGSDYSAADAGRQFSLGNQINCAFEVENVSENTDIVVRTSDLERAMITISVNDEDNHARGYRIADEFAFEKDYEYNVFYEASSCCTQKSTAFSKADEKQFDVPFGCHYFLLCDNTFPDVFYECGSESYYLECACDRWNPYTEMNNWYFHGYSAKYGGTITVITTNYTPAEENDNMLASCAAEEGTSVLFPKEVDDTSMRTYFRGEGGEYAEPDSFEWRPVYDSNGIMHWYERAIFSGDMLLKLPSYADAFDYYLSDKPDSDVNVVRIERMEKDGEKCLRIRESDVPRGAAYLRKKLKTDYTVGNHPNDAYYVSFRAVCMPENKVVAEKIYGLNPVFYPKGSSAENTVFVFEDGLFYQYILKADLVAADNTVVLEYSAAPEGENRFSSLKYSYIFKSYSKENYESVSGHSNKTISPIVIDERSVLELPTGGNTAEAYVVSLVGRLAPYTEDLFDIDLENSDFGGATAKITNYDEETNSTRLPGIRNGATTWDDSAVIGVDKTLYLQLIGAEKKVEYIEVYCGEEYVPIEWLLLTDIAGRPIFIESSAFILRLEGGYYSYSEPLTIRIVYEEEEEGGEE